MQAPVHFHICMSSSAKRTRMPNKDTIANHFASRSTTEGMETEPQSLCISFSLQQVLIAQEETT